MEGKTIGDWAKLMFKEDVYFKFKANVYFQSSARWNTQANTAKDALLDGFCWSKSSEGHYYWENQFKLITGDESVI